MAKTLASAPCEAAESEDSDMELVFDFLEFSASDVPSGAVLHDQLLTSLALAMHRNTAAH